MLIADFLNLVLDDCLEDSRQKRLCGNSNEMAHRGTEAAIAECRACMAGDGMVQAMRELLQAARERAAASQGDADEWHWLAREAAVEWVASLISVILLQKRMPTIVPPTRGAAVAAAGLIAESQG
jgi:hypothetical protein